MQADQIKFVTNKFESYTAKKSFTLGATSISIVEGQEVLFDGTTVVVNEEKVSYPHLRGAIKMRWLVPTDQYSVDTVEVPVSANIQVRSAISTQQNTAQPPTRSMIATVQTDERIVMTNTQRQETMNELKTMRRTETARTESYSGTPGEYVVNRTFKTPARSETKLTPETAGLALREVDSVKIDPGQGLSESEYLARLSEEERVKYLADKKAAKAAKEADLSRVVAQVNAKTAGAKVVDGISTTVTTGGGTEVFDLSGLDSGKAEQSNVVAEGMVFRNTNGPKKAFKAETAATAPVPQAAETESKIGKNGTADTRKRIAKVLCPDFPEDYSFDEHWKRRLARIHLHYSDRPDVIRAVFAAESDDFKRVLLEEFPEAFQG